jgi:hypothetical protein
MYIIGILIEYVKKIHIKNVSVVIMVLTFNK